MAQLGGEIRTPASLRLETLKGQVDAAIASPVGRVEAAVGLPVSGTARPRPCRSRWTSRPAARCG